MEWWKERPWRLLQTNLREIDFKDLDPEKFVEDVKEFHATVLLLNAGGISASYPTGLPYHYQNPLAVGNELYEVVRLCHENGIRVLARCDFSKVKSEIYRAHTDWAFRTKNQEIMEYNGYVQTCINSPYQQEAAFEILKELFGKIPFDGLFCNMGGFQTRDYDFKDYGFCRCRNCRSRFRAMTGQELPEKEDFNDPVYVSYTQFQKQVIQDYRKKMVSFLKSLPGELCFDDADYARIEASTELKRRLPHWQYHASSNCRVITGDGKSGIICSNTSVDYAGYAMREISVSPRLQVLRLWQNLANRGALDYYFMGRCDNRLDRSAFSAVKEIFRFHKEHEEEYRGLRPVAEVLLRRQDRWVATEEEKGWIRVLTECHIPFCEILPWEFETADLSSFSTVLLPDSPSLTPVEEQRLDAFTAEGGTLILVGESGLSDAFQGKRERYHMECPGIRRVVRTDKNAMSALLLKREEEQELFPSSKETKGFGAWDTYLYLEEENGTEKLLYFVPPHPYGPPECCYFTKTTENAGIYLHRFQKGKCLVIPWNPGTFYSKTGHDNPFLFMKDVLMTVCALEGLGEQISPMVETTLSVREDQSLFLQLVNTSGCFGVSFFEPLSVYDLKLTLPGVKERQYKARALRGGRVQVSSTDKGLEIMLSELTDYEAVIIEQE